MITFVCRKVEEYSRCLDKISRRRIMSFLYGLPRCGRWLKIFHGPIPEIRPPMTNDPSQFARRSFQPRIALILLGLFVIICASVIVTDLFSPRNRLSTPAGDRY